MLSRAEVQAVLARPPALVCTHPESGAVRALYDCPDISLREPGGPRVRLIVATHPETSAPHKIGKKRDGVIYEVLVTKLAAPAFTAKDVLDLYLHRGSFETVLADEDAEQDADRWCSHTPCGQEFWQIVNQWIWNLRMELGQHVSPIPMRTTEFAAASEPVSASEPAAASEPAPLVEYGPTRVGSSVVYPWLSRIGFSPIPRTERFCALLTIRFLRKNVAPPRDGSLRVLYAARIGDCRQCELRAECQESLSTLKPRRVSAVYWPRTSSASPLPPAPILGPPELLSLPSPLLGPFPVLWHDWPRCHIRRRWVQVLRSETVMVAMEAIPLPDQARELDEPVITRAQRAHWRFSWEQRLAHNARPSTAPPLTLTLHGLPATFAHAYGFALLEAA